MPTNVQLDYFLSYVGVETEDTEGTPVIVYYPRHMYTSELTSQHNVWLDAIDDVAEFMGIDVVEVERLFPLEDRVFRIHTAPNSDYRVVWAKIRKD